MSDEPAALDLETGDDKPPAQAKPKAKPRSGRPPRENVSSELKGSISGGLNELAEWLDPRDEELAGTLRDSAPRIAEFLAVHAARRAKVAQGVRYVFAKGGPFAALRAFGPLSRAIGERLRRRELEQAGGDLGAPDCGLDHEHDSSCFPSLRAPVGVPDEGPVRADA